MRVKKKKASITIIDVAREANVSTATVSRYLNNGIINERTAHKVKQVIERLNYVPNEGARGIASTKDPKNINVLLPNIINIKNAEILTSILEIMTIYKYNIFIKLHDNNEETIDTLISRIVNSHESKTIIYVGKKIKLKKTEDVMIIDSNNFSETNNYDLGIILAGNSIKANKREV